MTLQSRSSDRSRWYLSISQSAGKAPAAGVIRAALTRELYEGRAWFGRSEIEQLGTLSDAQSCAQRIATLVRGSPEMALCHTLKPQDALSLLSP